MEVMVDSRSCERLDVKPGDPPGRLSSFFDAALDVVYPYLSRRCAGDRSLAEDLTQETFVRAVRTLQRGEIDRLTIGWMVTSAQHRLIDHYRRESRRTRLLRLLPALDSEQSCDDLEDSVLKREAVTGWLDRLPPDQRLVVVLHHIDDLSVRDVAARTGRSERAVESSLARARRTLRRLGDVAEEDRDV
jgi:RNA polymerase sigma-70 factor (ECF subfamily)